MLQYLLEGCSVYSSMSLNKCMESCKHPNNQDTEEFHQQKIPVLPLCSQLLPSAPHLKVSLLTCQKSSLRLGVVKWLAVKICKHSSLSAFCKALPVPVSYAWQEIFFSCYTWGKDPGKMVPPWWRLSRVFPAPEEWNNGESHGISCPGKTWQGGLILEEASPQLCPGMSGRNRLVSSAWPWFCCMPGHIIPNYLQGYSQAEGSKEGIVAVTESATVSGWTGERNGSGHSAVDRKWAALGSPVSWCLTAGGLTQGGLRECPKKGGKFQKRLSYFNRTKPIGRKRNQPGKHEGQFSVLTGNWSVNGGNHGSL